MTGKTKVFALLFGTALTSASTAYADMNYGTGDSKLSFEWQKDSKGNNILVQNDNASDIVFNYSNTNTSSRLVNPTGDINNNFIGIDSPDETAGLAINNQNNNIGIITGDFIGNTVTKGQDSYGVAIYNNAGTIQEIKANFINNGKKSANTGYGGAIYNGSATATTTSAVIGDITGHFIGNRIEAHDGYGGAIYNGTNLASGVASSQIGNIAGDFIGNGIYSTNVSNAYGGAIYNGAPNENVVFSIGDITGDFIGNYASTPLYNSNTGDARGGAVYNTKGTIGTITGDFINNYVYSNKSADGGAIYNVGATGYIADIANIIGNFTGNRAQADHSVYKYDYISTYGGAIYNSYAHIGEIRGDFTDNQALTKDQGVFYVYGGAIYNSVSSIDLIVGSFYNNSAESANGYANGGAIYNTTGWSGPEAKIALSSATFEENHVLGKVVYGGAIYNYTMGTTPATINIENAVFEKNYAESSGADGKAFGGAIYNRLGIINMTNTSFTNNSVKATGTNSQVLGGAIYNTGDLTIKAENDGVSLFHGNKTIAADGTETNNAIYMVKESTKPDLKLEAKTGGMIIFDDEIEAATQSKAADMSNIIITGDETGRVEFNNAVKGFGTITSSDVTMALGSLISGMDKTAVSVTNGKLDMENGEIQTVAMKSFTVTGDTKFGFDADMSTGSADKIITSAGSSGNLKVDSVKILGDNANGGSITLFEDSGSNVGITFDVADFAAYSSKYKYTFTDAGSGTLNATAERNNYGLNGAVSDEDANNKSYTVSDDGSDVNADLGQLEGDQLIIEGNDNTLSGTGFGGMKTSDGQQLEVRDAVVEGFSSEEGGFVNSEGSLTVKNTGMENNSSAGRGGAIYAKGTVDIVTDDGKEHKFSGNKANIASGEGDDNAVYMDGGQLNLQATNGSLTFDDTIDGSDYTLNINGGNDGEINFNNAVSNAKEVNINGSRVRLADDSYLDGNRINLNGGELRLDNGLLGVSSFALLKGGNGVLHFDLDTVKGVSDLIKTEKLEGTVNLIGHNIGGDDTDYAGKYTDEQIVSRTANIDDDSDSDASSEENGLRDSIKFAEVAQAGDGKFNIFRVENSAYDWETYSTAGEEGSEDWLMKVKKSDGKDVVVAEVAAYLGLPSAGFEQTRDLLRNVEDKVASTMGYYDNCHGWYDYSYDGAALKNLWVAPRYSASKIKSPIRYDADIYGLEAGADVQSDIHNRLGVFASYRHGEYDFNGKTDYYRASGSSDIDMDSYLLGLYYRYTSQRWWAMGSIFGGLLDADIKSYDGVKADTKGTEYGAAVTAGYGVSLAKNLMLEPQAGVSYTLIDWDNFSDGYKKIRLNKASQFEMEAGLKLEKTFMLNTEPAKVFVKPSVIQVISNGGKVRIGDLAGLNGLDDETLGRIAAGASYHLDEHWSFFGDVSYTFGSDYRNTAAKVGLNYAF